ncbi:sigma-70 family RNA polymerase sigma factor [bacterium]|nr:MAG: sigma-70 family RNA polymerase sigma factor [bacterium]
MQILSEFEKKKQVDFKNEILPHLDSLYNFALRLTNDHHESEDLIQDTLVKAYRFFDSYEKGTYAKAWLFRILKNSFINRYRKASKSPDQVDYDEIASFYETIRSEQSDTTDYQEILFREQLGDEVSLALKKLPEDFRTVVVLCDIDGFTYEETANMLDVPIGTIRSRLHRGRSLLRSILQDYAMKRGYS